MKHITEINIQNINLQTSVIGASNRKYSDETSMKLISHTPCFDGFVNTSNRLEDYREGDKKKKKDLSGLFLGKKREEHKKVDVEDMDAC